METIVTAVLLIVGLAVGAAAAWRLRGRELIAERERALRAEAAQTALMAELHAERLALADARATLAAEERGHQREVEALTALRGEIATKMQALASDALQQNQKSFFEVATETFNSHKREADKTLEQRQTEITALLAPITNPCTPALSPACVLGVRSLNRHSAPCGPSTTSHSYKSALPDPAPEPLVRRRSSVNNTRSP